jgi:hypothetical protein
MTTRQRVNDVLTDGLVIVGVVLVAAGMWTLCPPIALIVVGLACVALGVWRSL